MAQDIEHDLDILDLGDVAEDDGLGREEGRGDAGQGRVLVAADLDPALDREAAFDDVLVHAATLREKGGIVNSVAGKAPFLRQARFSGIIAFRHRGATRPADAAREVPMSYKLDGAKFPTLDELVEALYPLYADKMSIEEFRKYAEEHAEKS